MTTETLRDPMSATNLDELAEILNEWAQRIAEDEPCVGSHDNPDMVTEYAADLTSLPTFGGAEPKSTSEVWSWDASRVLVDGPQITVGVTGWEIQPRCHACREATFHCDCD